MSKKYKKPCLKEYLRRARQALKKISAGNADESDYTALRLAAKNIGAVLHAMNAITESHLLESMALSMQIQPHVDDFSTRVGTPDPQKLQGLFVSAEALIKNWAGCK